MGTNIKIQIDPADKILLRRSLNKNGNGQKFFTHEVRRLSDPYVPLDNGPLKKSAQELVNRIEYVQPYARRQYYENSGVGRQGTKKYSKHNYKCTRGKEWDKRMWADRGKEIVQSVAKYCGGKVK